MPVLRHNTYGKSRVRMVKVRRETTPHVVRDIEVEILLTGEFDSAHTAGDNSLVVPTDTMKNTVYALGHDHPIDSIESFARDLAAHFVREYDQVEAACVDIQENPWNVLTSDPTAHAFTQPQGAQPTAQAEADASGATVTSGLTRWVILKTARSGFAGFPRDAYTTLPETDDRLFGTAVDATWSYSQREASSAEFNAHRSLITAALRDTFAAHDSRSVQHTLYAMASAAIEACPAIDEVTLRLPNRHCLLVDLTPFGRENRNEIFCPVDEPHGTIEATVSRE